jgi:hypothetical protein
VCTVGWLKPAARAGVQADAVMPGVRQREA